MIPEFAIIGHPNEGKSSVVSTLTEDDQIQISQFPGETKVSKRYTITIDGEKIISFVDTPGFQVPKKTLAWFKAFKGPLEKIVETFINTFKHDPFYADECELLKPVAKGAGIIYVVDGARPVRNDDLAEMEILRLTGRPRMAIINSKTNEKNYISDWKLEFRKHFNSIREFDSNSADFSERIKMLESLKAIDQELEDVLSCVIFAFTKEWEKRNSLVAALISLTIEKSLSFDVSETVTLSYDNEKVKDRLDKKYQDSIKNFEKLMFKKIRTLYKHNLFEYHLSEYSILRHDLFSKQTWEVLGLTRQQLAAAGAVIGGTAGAVLDTAAAGITFGIFTAVGGVLGAGSAWFGGKKMTRVKKAGIRLGQDKLQLGPNKNIQLLYILIDRVLIYYSHIINRPHGRRDLQELSQKKESDKKGYSTGFSTNQKKICSRYFKVVSGQSLIKDKKVVSDFEELIESMLNKISTG
ncbi:MAG: GTPase/DUF3482 domain-containing protein [Desulfobacula sp.]|jgi:hypothetical protein|nr:GTPase/DUF3482 domain-containing protein [Desulfobacula sp.]